MERLTTFNGDCLDSIGKACRVSNSCSKQCLKNQLRRALKRLADYENAGDVPPAPEYPDRAVCFPGQYAWIFRRKQGRPGKDKNCYVLDYGQIKNAQYTSEGKLLVSVTGKGTGLLHERVFLTRQEAENAQAAFMKQSKLIEDYETYHRM